MKVSSEPVDKQALPSVVLICHEEDIVDSQGIAGWLAPEFSLSGIVFIWDDRAARLRRVYREYRRVGLWRLIDVLLFRVYYRLRWARADRRWLQRAVAVMRDKYSADISRQPRITVNNPNADEVREFVRKLQPDLLLARCKYILRPAIFTLPRYGSYVLHPGICPAYRNAHGCFWALVNRDLANVGMTLLKVDEGIDTGPVYLRASYAFDELRESHIRIQHRVVLENLDAIAAVFFALCRNAVQPQVVNSAYSVNWGQPWLTAYLRWRRRGKAARVIS